MFKRNICYTNSYFKSAPFKQFIDQIGFIRLTNTESKILNLYYDINKCQIYHYFLKKIHIFFVTNM